MNMTKEKLKIMIVDDHPIVRDGIRKIIEIEDDMYVCSESENANDAVKLISSSKPDLAIVDISLQGNVNGIDLIKSMKTRFPGVKTIVLSLMDESVYAERAIMAGAEGYIMKKEASGKVVEAIRTVLSGELYLSEKISKKIIHKLVRGVSNTDSTPVDILSNREFEVFQLVGNGFSTREIAEKLNLSLHTIESHKKNIMKKLDIDNSTRLAQHAIQWVIAQYK